MNKSHSYLPYQRRLVKNKKTKLQQWVPFSEEELAKRGYKEVAAAEKKILDNLDGPEARDFYLNMAKTKLDNHPILKKAFETFWSETKKEQSSLGQLYRQLDFSQFLERLVFPRLGKVYSNGRALTARRGAPAIPFGTEEENQEFLLRVGTKEDTDNYFKHYLTIPEMALSSFVCVANVSLACRSGFRPSKGKQDRPIEKENLIKKPIISVPAAGCDLRGGLSVYPDVLLIDPDKLPDRTDKVNYYWQLLANSSRTSKMEKKNWKRWLNHYKTINSRIRKNIARVKKRCEQSHGFKAVQSMLYGERRRDCQTTIDIFQWMHRTQLSIDTAIYVTAQTIKSYPESHFGDTMIIPGIGLGAFGFSGITDTKQYQNAFVTCVTRSINENHEYWQGVLNTFEIQNIEYRKWRNSKSLKSYFTTAKNNYDWYITKILQRTEPCIITTIDLYPFMDRSQRRFYLPRNESEIKPNPQTIIPAAIVLCGDSAAQDGNEFLTTHSIDSSNDPAIYTSFEHANLILRLKYESQHYQQLLKMKYDRGLEIDDKDIKSCLEKVLEKERLQQIKNFRDHINKKLREITDRNLVDYHYDGFRFKSNFKGFWEISLDQDRLLLGQLFHEIVIHVVDEINFHMNISQEKFFCQINTNNESKTKIVIEDPQVIAEFLTELCDINVAAFYHAFGLNVPSPASIAITATAEKKPLEQFKPKLKISLPPGDETKPEKPPVKLELFSPAATDTTDELKEKLVKNIQDELKKHKGKFGDLAGVFAPYEISLNEQRLLLHFVHSGASSKAVIPLSQHLKINKEKLYQGYELNRYPCQCIAIEDHKIIAIFLKKMANVENVPELYQKFGLDYNELVTDVPTMTK